MDVSNEYLIRPYRLPVTTLGAGGYSDELSTLLELRNVVEDIRQITTQTSL